MLPCNCHDKIPAMKRQKGSTISSFTCEEEQSCHCIKDGNTGSEGHYLTLATMFGSGKYNGNSKNANNTYTGTCSEA